MERPQSSSENGFTQAHDVQVNEEIFLRYFVIQSLQLLTENLKQLLFVVRQKQCQVTPGQTERAFAQYFA